MGPAVMADLVTAFYNLGTGLGIGLDGKAGNEPGRRDFLSFQQGQDSTRAHNPEFASRDRCWCGHAPGDVSRHHIEIESQADNMLCHKALYTIVIAICRVCFRSLIDTIRLSESGQVPVKA